MKINLRLLQKFVEIEKKNYVSVIRLNNPKKKNALCSKMIQDLKDSLDEVSKSNAKIILLESTGNVFSSGHDLKEMKTLTSQQQKELFISSSKIFQLLKSINQVVIGKVDGIVTAAGSQLVTSCDLILCTPESTFATSGVNYGLFCHTPGIPLVRSMNSVKKAFEMLITGDSITSKEALQYGLVNYVVDKDKMEEETQKLCDRILKNSSKVIGFGKKIFYQQIELNESNAYKIGIDAMVENLEYQDSKEGLNAFSEKRKPKWEE